MKQEELKNILKSRNFKSTDDRNQSFIFKFTDNELFRDGQFIGNYNIVLKKQDFFLTFSNMQSSIWTADFKNVLLVSEAIKIILNYDHTDLQKKGRIDITLVGQ